MNRRRLLAIALLIAGAAVFTLATSIEKNRHHDEPTAGVASGETRTEEGESAEQRAAEEPASRTDAKESSEGTILGIDRESTGLVMFAVILSLTLAVLLWQRPTRVTWIVVGAVTLIFAVFDIAEVLHQLDASEASLAALAAAVAATHLTTTGIAALETRAPTTT